MKKLLLIFICTSFTSCGTGRESIVTDNGPSQAQIDYEAMKAEEARRAEEIRLAEEARRLAVKQNIWDVFRQDSAAGRQPTLDAVVADMQAIPLTECPEDFGAAYYAHIAAWKDAKAIADTLAVLNSDESKQRTLVRSFISTILELKSTPFADHLAFEQRLKAEESQASAEIKATFKETKRVASTYGVYWPH